MEAIAIAVLITSGLVIATLSMGMGIGGGILWTPLLILGFGLEPAEAVSASLLIQIAGLSSGTLAYHRAGLVDLRLSFQLYLIALPGVLLGSLFSLELPRAWVQLALGVAAMMLALLFVSTQEVAKRSGGARQLRLTQHKDLMAIPAFFGLMMGLLSTGIGEWLVPAFKQRFGLGMRQAIGIIIPLMLMLAISASLLRGLAGDFSHWSIALYGALGTLIGAQLGPRINQLLSERLLKEAFIYLMTLISIHMVFQAV